MKKRLLLLSFLLLLGISCNDNGDQKKDHDQKDRKQEKLISDHDQLEEAKAIARKLMEGMHKVEREELSRVEFESASRPLQKKLNVLIMALDKEELRELEDYRKQLLAEQVGGKL